MKCFQSIQTTFFFVAMLSFAADVSGGALRGAPDAKPFEILMVVTGHETIGNTETGLWLEEFSVPYFIFRDAGYDVTVASVNGGAAPVDPRSMTQETIPENAEEAVLILQDTDPLAEIDLSQYVAVFFPGGHGTMFDFPNNPPIQKTVEYFLLQQRPTALVCHGPAALVGAKDASGAPVVKGRKVAVFTDAEERAVGLTEEVPFLLQSKLESLGAEVVAGDNFQEQVIVDGNLVTGQNPASSEKAARELLRLLK